MEPARFATALMVLALTTPTFAVWASPLSDLERDHWRGEVRALGLDPNQVVFPFALTEEMANWAATQVPGAENQGALDILQALQAAMFDREAFAFDYADNLTLTAEQAFHERRGNCMSFTALFVAMARSLGVPTTLVSVQKAPDFQRSDDLVVVNRHVVAGYRSPNSWHLYDFYITSSTPYVHQRSIDDVHASAMYHANLGGMALRDEDDEEAFRHLRLATTLAPDWAPAWVNLGVALFRSGDPDAAFLAHSTALSLEPDNSSALTNMAIIYRSRGRLPEAEAALAAAARKTRNPFTLIALADMEIGRENLGQARAHLRRARWWFNKEPEVYDALARLERAEGNDVEAHRYSLQAAKLRREREAESR